ncbi:MAG: phosphopantetheine-binding protein [Mycoplasmataceae bacterium]|jgi:acyl carrier protein|nr:phosphopantetheine-binding protein [Mycoplasmataceae bacterium]
MEKIEIINTLKKIATNRGVRFDAKDINRPLKEIGVDSLTGISIIVDMESAFNITIPDDKLTTIKTFNELIDLIVELAK